jgi:hypothetical protein
MDGHGRFVYSFFEALEKEGLVLDDYTIELYDTEKVVNEWHRHFMPTGVRVVEDSILRGYDHVSTQLYLNFCGLGAQAPLVLDFLRHRKSELFISFSLERWVAGNGSNRDLVVQWIWERFHSVGISCRKSVNFVTWWIRSPPVVPVAADAGGAAGGDVDGDVIILGDIAGDVIILGDVIGDVVILGDIAGDVIIG